MDYQISMLKLLFEKGKLNYRRIAKDLGDLHLKTTRRELDSLIQKGLIKEEGRKNWVPHKGKKLFYSLTAKGRREYIQIAFDNLNEGLKVLKEIAGEILSDPKKIEEWKKLSREREHALLKTEIAEDKTLEERIKSTQTVEREIYGPLKESYRNLHSLVCQLSLPFMKRDVGSQMFIGFTKTGGLYFITTEALKAEGFDLL